MSVFERLKCPINYLDRSKRDNCLTISTEINSSRLKIEVKLFFLENIRFNFTIFSTRRVILEAKFRPLDHNFY